MSVCRVLFVCFGNICRSPTAEAVFRKTVESRGLAGQFEIDSAGIAHRHTGKPPHNRAQEAAARRGIDLANLRGRQVDANDMAAFDYIIAMDRDNYRDLQHLAAAEHRHKIHLFLELSPNTEGDEVPDPYYGGADSFEQVLDLIERASADLLEYLIADLSAKNTGLCCREEDVQAV